MKRLILAAAFAAALPAAAHAQAARGAPVEIVPLPVAPGNCSGSVGTTAGQIISATGVTRNFFLQNVGTSNIGVSWFTTSPVIGASGTYTLAPGATLNSTATGAPTGVAIYAVSSAAGGVLTCSFN